METHSSVQWASFHRAACPLLLLKLPKCCAAAVQQSDLLSVLRFLPTHQHCLNPTDTVLLVLIRCWSWRLPRNFKSWFSRNRTYKTKTKQKPTKQKPPHLYSTTQKTGTTKRGKAKDSQLNSSKWTKNTHWAQAWKSSTPSQSLSWLQATCWPRHVTLHAFSEYPVCPARYVMEFIQHCI